MRARRSAVQDVNRSRPTRICRSLGYECPGRTIAGPRRVAIDGLADAADIVIGTHCRRCRRDLAWWYHEQRGSASDTRQLSLCTHVDVLTMSATPIPGAR